MTRSQFVWDHHPQCLFSMGLCTCMDEGKQLVDLTRYTHPVDATAALVRAEWLRKAGLPTTPDVVKDAK